VADFSGRDVTWLERRRAELFTLISQAGDFRRGSLNAVWRKCGKPNCACAQPGHRGHGPQWNLTRRIGGKTVNVHLKPGPELDKVRREVADLVEEVSQVSEAICAARPVRAGPAPLPPGGEKGARGAARGDRRRRGRQARRPGRGHARRQPGAWACWSRRCARRWPPRARRCCRRCWMSRMTGMPARAPGAAAAGRPCMRAVARRRSPPSRGRCASPGPGITVPPASTGSRPATGSSACGPAARCPRAWPR
jgi:hypothetical protein